MLEDTVKKILQARVYEAARETPISPASFLSRRLNNQILIKREDLQPVYSFKIRGAYNKMAQLSDEQKAKGVIAASAGNHAQGLALAARLMGVKAVIVMPRITPEIKVAAVRARGAKVVLKGDAFAAAAEHAQTLIEEHGYTYIPPFDDIDVVAGQGTIGMEILHQHSGPLDAIFVPVGGGGLIAGIGRALRGLAPDARLIGVQSDATYSMHAAFEAGRVVETVVGRTLADGLAGEVVEESYRRARAVADEMRLVEESRLPSAIRSLYRRDGVVAEGAGATGPALIQQGDIELEGPVVIVISGGNIDAEKLAGIFGST